MSKNEIDPRVLNLLREIGDLAEHATLTGGLSGGAVQTVSRYNSILRLLEDDDHIPEGLFSRLPDDTAYGQVGVEARMLLAFVEGERKPAAGFSANFDAGVLVRLAPFVRGEDLADLIREHVRQGANIDGKVLTSLAPFLDSGSLGELIKSHLRKLKPEDQASQKPKEEPAPQTPATRDIVSSETEPKMTLEQLAQEIKRPDITIEERQELAVQIAQIAHEQATKTY